MRSSSCSSTQAGHSDPFEELCHRVGAIAYSGLADGNRKLVSLEGSAQKLTGYTSDAFVGGRVSFADLIHFEDRAHVLTELGLALLERRRFELCYRIVDAGGDVRWVWEIGSVEEDDESGARLLRGWMFDITSSPQTRAHELVEGLVSGVAHDLKNLFAILVSGSEYLQGMLDQGSRAQDQAAQLRDVAKSSSRLAQQLTRLVGHRPPSQSPTNLNEIVACLEPVVQALVGDQVRVDVRLDPELKVARVTPLELERILLNLASNARRAMPQGGHLAILASKVQVHEPRSGSRGRLLPGWYAVLSVGDTGAGMVEAEVTRAFERGFSTGGSTGLGLATVRQVVEERGGAIDVQSEPGQGTTFDVYLPLCTDRGIGRDSLIRPR